jgi:hypothetical protein
MAENKCKKQTVSKKDRQAYYAAQFFKTKANKLRRAKRRDRLAAKRTLKALAKTVAATTSTNQ